MGKSADGLKSKVEIKEAVSELSENWDLRPPKTVTNLAACGQPIKAMAFTIFCDEERAKVMEAHPELRSSEISFQLYRSWAEMETYVKRDFLIKAKKELPRRRQDDKDKKSGGGGPSPELVEAGGTPPSPLPGGDGPEVIFGGRYRVRLHVGSGSFGDVYCCIDSMTDENVAIKLEKRIRGASELLHEKYIYQALEGGEGIPRIHYFGKEPERDRNMLVMDFVGPSLESLFSYCRRRFSLKTVLMLAPEMISRLEYIHGKGIIHRDVKPDNFVMGIGPIFDKLHLIDYGMAKWYWKSRTDKHVDYRSGRFSFGTPRYASISALRGVEQSRRDDLEAVAYILIYFLRGYLPWQKVKDPNLRRQHFLRVEMKRDTSAETLAKGYPVEFAKYLDYCKDLEFEELPDYDYLRQLFHDLFKRLGYKNDKMYDWTLALEREQQKLEGSKGEATAVVPEVKVAQEAEPQPVEL